MIISSQFSCILDVSMFYFQSLFVTGHCPSKKNCSYNIINICLKDHPNSLLFDFPCDGFLSLLTPVCQDDAFRYGRRNSGISYLFVLAASMLNAPSASATNSSWKSSEGMLVHERPRWPYTRLICASSMKIDANIGLPDRQANLAKHRWNPAK